MTTITLDEGRAWRSGEDAVALARTLSRAHDRFVETGHTTPGLRPLVADSWQRCVDSGVDPERSLPPVELVDDELESWRAAHPLAPVLPVMQRPLVDEDEETASLAALSAP